MVDGRKGTEVYWEGTCSGNGRMDVKKVRGDWISVCLMGARKSIFLRCFESEAAKGKEKGCEEGTVRGMGEEKGKKG